MRTRKRRKSWSPNATPEVCRHHDHQLTVSNTFEKLSCQRANLDNSSSDYHYCHHQHYCHYHAIDNQTKCNNLNKHCNAKSTKATRPFRKPVNLPDSFITLLYLSTCFLLFYNEATNQRNPFHPLPIQSVTCQRLSKTLPIQTQQQSQASKPFLPKPQTSSHHNSKTTTLEIVAQQGGIIKDKNVTLTRDLNPIVITKDIIIKKDAKLTIESGAELLFERKKGIIVYGTLDILGSPNNRVKLNLLKSQQSATVNYRSHTNNLQQVRLVDGDLPSEGRVQIKFNDRWHSLCTNSKNLTAADIKVICQQVGYQDGYWYKWFPRRNDTTLQIMSKSFHCVGTEAALNQCQRWNRLRAGGGVCDNQSDIGIRCARTLVFGSQPGSSYDYWKGIEFVNGETNHEYVLEGQMKQRVSKSSLTHLSISDAGQNQAGNATAAIRVYGQPPKINNIEIKNSIYGIMIEDTEDAFGISNVKISNNLGYPLFINTSWGKVSLDNIHVENNGGDGIRIVRHEKILVGPHDFCRFANLGSSQSFPVILSHEQTFFTSGRDCCQEFVSNNQLTAHFPVLRSTPNNLLPEGDNNRRISIPPGVNIGKDADLVIYDDYQDEYPFRISVRNSTRAQSIVSRSGRLKICYKPATYRTVLFTVVVVADVDDEWSGTARDVEISNSFIKNNGGRGIWIDNQRSGVKLMNTTVLNHNYLSGVHVENGTGEVIIQGCNISHNLGHGLLINLAGGYYHVDNSTISDNLLKGIAIEYDKRPELVPFNHTMHLGFSLIARNGENGIFIGNVCRSDAFWNISMNSFIGNGEDAIQFQSCLPNPETVMNFKQLSSRLNLSDSDLAFHNNFQELTISHNIFLSNIRRAIRIAPVFFVKAFIRHNTFKDHQLAVLYVSNQKSAENDPDFSMQSTTNIRIASNRFYSNLGRYVANIGVQEDNPKHSLIFTKNTLENNVITEPYNDLRPRSRVSAVVVVSSSNTKVIRNRFNNPQSSFDLGSHLEMHYKIINATTNFWGRGLDAASIYRRIFDRKNRYNLAQIEFLQYLLSPEDLEYATDLSFDRERDKITTFKNGSRLGGEVKGYEDLPSETYIVQDDIFVRPGAHLILRPGTVLKFHDGVGVMVQGRLDAIGQTSSQIVFTSMMSLNRTPQRASATTTPIPKSNTWVSHQPPEDGHEEEYEPSSQYRSSRPSPSDRSLAIKKRQASNLNAQSVRLSHTTMGRLEVQMEGVWGSVCDYNFDIDDAAVACQQLGMVLNREDWLLERFQYASNDRQHYSMMSTNVLMTNLRCDPTLDTDLTKCKAEVSLKGDFDGICNSEVGIKCFPPSWSGIRIGMGAEISTLNHIVVQRAGMFDYASYQLKPALQIDFNRHLISAINVKSNGDSGLGILWNDVIGRHFSELSLSDSKFLNNERHGIELKTRGLTIKSCLISNNRQHGLDYNPSFSQQQLTELLSWLHTYKNSENIVTLSPPLESRYISVPSSEDSYRIFVFQKNPQPDLNETFTISTDLGHMLSLQLLNPIHPESTETLNMSLGTNPESPVWDLRVNATSLPMVSPGYKFHFNYSTGRKPKGNIVLYIRSRFNNRILKQLNKFIPAYLISNKFEQTATNINTKLINTIVITNSNITRNGLGLKFRQPNQPTDNQFSYNLRYANETTNITNNLFDENRFSSIFVNSDDYNFHVESANTTVPSSEITYNLLGNKIRRNMDGIRQFNRDIRQSYNVFHWTINDTSLDYNRNGGINIVLPYFWKYDTNLSHTIEISNNTFWRNSNFEFSIGGHFAMLNLTENMFKDNKCKSHLIAFRGMEKRMLLRRNVIEQNFCGRIIEVNIASHADKMGLIPAVFEYNSIRYNRRLPTNVTMSASSTGSRHPRLKHLHPHETDYVLSLKGIQPLNITRNLFLNPDLRFELIAGIASDPEEPTINAMENYWGSALQAEIDERIFDFDDWNDYSIANISPYLTQDSFASASVKSERKEFSFININRPLGGRLTRSLTIPYRREPYLVVSDLTVMPDVRLTIERGTTLEFMPNVGILVLGELIAAGTRERPILMRPALSAQDIMPLYQYLFPPRVKPSILHMDANDPLSYENNFRSYQSAFPIDLGSIRLCKNEICNDGFHIYENNVEDQTLRQEVLRSSNNTWKLDGFLEIFNMTTLQWIPICDPLFTEHSARVVCRQLGYSHLSIYKRGRRYTIEQEQISSIKNWPDSLQCDGDETILSSCSMVPRSSSTNHTTTCTREGNQFIYVYCADLPDPLNINSTQTHSITTENVEHWGGLRFSGPSVSMGVNIYDSRDSYNMISQAQGRTQSILQYINVKGAGILHMKRSAAVQVFQSNVRIEYTSITESAHHGLEYVTSQGDQNFHQLRIRNNHGVGFNHLSLTGSSSTNRVSPYLPLKHLDVSPETYGMINICGSKKEIQVEERILLFYKYSSQASDCIRIISSKLPIKHIGIRLLQFDLFNSTPYTVKPDSIRIYDGDIFDRESRLLADLSVTERHRLERPELKFYQTSDSAMTVRLHASGASSLYGFIAEVVTTPVSYNIQRDSYNNLTYSDITNNRLGALTISAAGESSPNLIVKNNRFESNCLHLFGNFTSCISPIYMELQNCQKLRLINNLIRANQGGAVIKSYSHSAVSALEAAIENNVFESNQNNNILALLGPKTDPYQSVRVMQNFFTGNMAQYVSDILLSRIVANFSYNIVSSNIGKHQIEVLGFDKLPLSHQKFYNNWIYNNTATMERDKSTIIGNSAGQQYRDNYLVNPDNHFEISTMNWSRYDTKPLHTIKDDETIHLTSGDGSTKDIFRKAADAIPLDIVDTKKLDLFHATIDALQNWWGFNSTPAIQGRIRDNIQHGELLKVDFVPYLATNRTVLSGICAGGWQRVGDICLVYVGARMNYQEAKEFCDREGASLLLLRGNHYELSDFIRTKEREFDPKVDRIWIRSFDVSREACPALNDFRTKNYDCLDRNSFLCEKDPLVIVNLLHWHRETGGLVALILAMVTLILTFCCTLCWVYKSRQMQKEKIRRRKNSVLYSSMRSNRGPYSSSNSISEQFLHRQLYNTENSSITDLSLSTQFTQPSDSAHLVRLDPGYTASQTNPLNAMEEVPYANSRALPFYSPQPANNPTYVSPTPTKERIAKQSLSSVSPNYDSPPIRKPIVSPTVILPNHNNNLKIIREQFDSKPPLPLPPPQPFNYDHMSPIPEEQFSVPVTPAPSYREVHPKAFSNGSRTPSYSGSQAGDISTDPMPLISTAYSQINHMLNSKRNFQSPIYDFKTIQQYSPLPPDPVSSNTENRMRDIDDSDSTAPTYYNNQLLENYEESSQSYLESEIEAYNRALQRLNNDTTSIIITERSSTTDIYSSQLTRTSIIDSQTDLVSMRPQSSSEHVDNELRGAHSNRAYSDTASGSQRNRYYAETSLDEEPTMAPTSMFGSSQRLSPVSSSDGQQDSKQGSRVFLETSFG